MLTGIHIVILGGDARQLEVISKLNELDATLDLVGFDQLDRYYTGVSKVDLEDIEYEKVDAIVLPVSGTNGDGVVETIFSDKTIRIHEDWLKKTPEHCVIYSGITTPYLSNCAKKCNREVVKLFERDDVAIYNSIPTAEGTLMIVIQNTDITIHQSNVIVLGLGRTGMTLARTFDALGANVRVGAREPESLARIREMGMTPFQIKDLESQVVDVDVCINTIPAKVLTGKVLSRVPSRALIVDIASNPGGTDFRYAEKRGIKALHVLGIPAMVAPKTAGRIIGNVLSELLLEKFVEEDDESGL
ncbi:dipicolinate synthase subunit A [Pullulanibacillus pueri]|uniref:Dipicolinate synthase subunit A n=1 Tax=Pullulanibacillus pueri TaxID=1437324 RepID=A0A8J2ZW55_9BACL|nr:dipicolinic acid synthetase subunit A [Pullulanibacillus pueri]MBM7682527.1 dipicolinate synthase subunit A [Pullulanibacillus pueri]GGH82045.1 dipicolinate synthase subunit A [Pullulanibacillus pueri]